MSYRRCAKSSSTAVMDFRLSLPTRALPVVLFAGALATLPAIGFLYQNGRLSWMLSVAGLAFIFSGAGWLARLQLSVLPVSLQLLRKAGCLEIVERDGSMARLGFGDIASVGMRLQGRRRHTVMLLRRNGAAFDIAESSSRAGAAKLSGEIENFIAGAARKNELYPDLPVFCTYHREGEVELVSWVESSMRAPLLAIGLLLSGTALAFGAAALNWQATLISAGVVLACAVLIAVLQRLFSVVRILSTRPGSLTLAEQRRQKKRHLAERAVTSFEPVRFTFEARRGVPRLVFPEREARSATLDRSLSFGQRLRGLLRGSRRSLVVSLYGFRVCDALALEVRLTRMIERAGRSVTPAQARPED